ncbi:MAG: tyrosine-type recombinase/integrase [Actinomycetota bacterium]
MQSNSRNRLPKIGVLNNNGSIQIRFDYQGQTYRLSGLGKYDDLLALANAKAIAEKIKIDLILGEFPIGDAKLSKYSPIQAQIVNYPTATAPSDSSPKEWGLRECWEFYKSLKEPTAPESTKKSQWKHIDKYIDQAPSDYLSLDNADKFFSWLKEKEADGSIAPRLRIVRAAVNLAIDMDKINRVNPFTKLYKLLDTTKKKQIRAFSKKEIKIIINAFKSGRFDPDKSAYSSAYYAPLVEFRFLTGCRPSEAIALTWEQIKEKDNGKMQIIFDRRWSEGELLQGTKNGVTARIFNCNQQLSDFLKELPRIPNKNNLVFPSAKGGYITNDNFSNRQWRPIIKKLVELGEVEFYLCWYDERHTFGTHASRHNPDLKTLSSMMGNSPDTLMKHYLAVNEDGDYLPEL